MADDGQSAVGWVVQRLRDGATAATAPGGIYQMGQGPPREGGWPVSPAGRRVGVQVIDDRPRYAQGPTRSGSTVLVRILTWDRNVAFEDLDNTIDAIDEDLDTGRDFYVPGLIKVTCYKDAGIPPDVDPTDEAVAVRGADYRLVVQPNLA